MEREAFNRNLRTLPKYRGPKTNLLPKSGTTVIKYEGENG